MAEAQSSHDKALPRPKKRKGELPEPLLVGGGLRVSGGTGDWFSDEALL